MAAPSTAIADWSATDDRWTLRLRGRWTEQRRWPTVLPPTGTVPAALTIDAAALEAWDSAGAAHLWQLLAPLTRQGATITWQAVPEGLQSALELALPPPGDAPALPVAPAQGLAARLQTAWREAMRTAAFFGEVLLALARLLRGRSDLRVGDLLRQLDQTGPLSLPIVSLTCVMVGLMLAYMGGAQLDRMGAQGFIADVVTVGMVRELAGLMTGVILTGRIGAAFAAQLASMQAGEEIDALRALGVDPVAYLVLPRLLALMLVAPLLIAYAALVGVLAGLPPAVAIYGVPAGEYLHRALDALTWTHLWIGVFKGTMYAALVALAGCREGLYAGRNAQAVGEAVTRSVVKALVWIVAAACGSTVAFQAMGF